MIELLKMCKGLINCAKTTHSKIMRNNIIQHQENWNKLSDVDQYWSILVDPDKIDNKWNLNGFYITGKTQISNLLTFLSNYGVKIHFASALDYDCGVGRLSEALSESFTYFTGVVFSRIMINLAKSHSKFTNLIYEKVNGKDLSNFQAKAFDFIIPLINLRHSPSNVQYNLVKEMVKLLKDDGVMVISFVTHWDLQNLLRNALNFISPKLTNYFLRIIQKLREKVWTL